MAKRLVLKKSEIISAIQSLRGFKREKAKVKLEQYTTDAISTADFLYFAGFDNDDIYGNLILDLGAGTGRLGLGALLFGAEYTVFLEKDPDAIEILKENADYLGMNGRFEIICGDVSVILDKIRRKSATTEIEADLEELEMAESEGSIEAKNSIESEGSIKAESSIEAGISKEAGIIKEEGRAVEDHESIGETKLIKIKDPSNVSESSIANKYSEHPDFFKEENFPEYLQNLLRKKSRNGKIITLMNPPFGVQQRGADKPFLELAMLVSDKIYAILNSSPKIRNFVGKIAKKNKWYIESIHSQKLTIKGTYPFHSKKIKSITADIYSFSRLKK